jgi:hypothetical protein
MQQYRPHPRTPGHGVARAAGHLRSVEARRRLSAPDSCGAPHQPPSDSAAGGAAVPRCGRFRANPPRQAEVSAATGMSAVLP